VQTAASLAPASAAVSQNAILHLHAPGPRTNITLVLLVNEAQPWGGFNDLNAE
jgi:hypothetical protein